MTIRILQTTAVLMFLTSALCAETLVLDETAYLRSHYTFDWDRVSPEVLETEGEKILGRGIKRKEKMVLKEMRKRDPKADAALWKNHVYCRVYGYGRTYADRIESPAPHGDWVSPDFDDSQWLHQRRPHLTGYGGGMRVRLACFRAWFDVADPGSAALKLSLAYRGGVRVLLNGKEIARGHLPDGDVTPATPAVTYPREAYLRTNEELTLAEKKQFARYIKTNRIFYRYVGGLCGPWDKQPTYKPAKNGQPELKRGGVRGGLPREVWMRILKQRDRRIETLALPRGLLRKGSNLLAIEVHRSDLHPLVLTGGWSSAWPHARLISLKLTATNTASAVPGIQRPRGMQAWVRDVNARTYATDFLEPGAASGVVRLVGARNGTYAAQVSVGSSGRLQNLCVIPTALKSEKGGHQIKADQVRVFPMVPRPASKMGWGGTGRNDMGRSIEQEKAANRAGWKKSADPRNKMPAVDYYGHIAWSLNAQPVKGVDVPENASRTFWISISVPCEAAPGVYRGTLQVKAEGAAPIGVPVRLEVTAWRLPDPRGFRTIVAAEQSPYGVAKQFKVPLWSDKHFKLMESSFFHMGRLGNDWLNVPVLIKTEFGNREDMMIPWIRKSDGSMSFDYTRLDRYLDLAIRHWGVPAVINFVVMHGAEGNVSEVMIVDERTKKTERVALSGKSASPKLRRELWGAFARSLYAHMKARGLEKSMYWGFAWDVEADPGLKPLMKGFVPSVRWTRGSHAFVPDEYHRAVSCIYAGRKRDFGNRGWKGRHINLVNPRQYSDAINVRGDYPPFPIRVWPDRALATGRQGVGRMGADYGTAYYNGFRQISPVGEPGFSIRNLYYFGENGAETSARAEILLEGVQETEVRVFLERAMDFNLVDDALKAEIRDTLERHMQETAFYPEGFADYELATLSQGWLTRSERLYRLAGKAALAIGMDLDRYEIETDIQARGTGKISVVLTNMRAVPLNWIVVKHPEWVQPERKKGVSAVKDKLGFTLNATALKPESSVAGDVVIQNASGDIERRISIKVKVGELAKLPMETCEFLSSEGYLPNQTLRRGEDMAVFNVEAVKSQSREFSLTNTSGAELQWKGIAADGWMKVTPSKGALAPGESVGLKISVTPPKGQLAALQSQLRIADGEGRQLLTRKVQAHVLPPYKKPELPQGATIPLKDFSTRKTLKLYRRRNLGTGQRLRYSFQHTTPLFDKAIKGMAASLPQVVAYDLTDKGITGFSAEVKLALLVKDAKRNTGYPSRVAFEIHVDGRIRASSGLMGLEDESRLLAVTGLEKAKELKLVTRFDAPEPKNITALLCSIWKNALLYRNGK